MTILSISNSSILHKIELSHVFWERGSTVLLHFIISRFFYHLEQEWRKSISGLNYFL
jgi:hypothetical protein